MKIQNKELFDTIKDDSIDQEIMNKKNKTKQIDEEKIQKCLKEMQIKNQEFYDNIEDKSIDGDTKNKSKRSDQN